MSAGMHGDPAACQKARVGITVKLLFPGAIQTASEGCYETLQPLVSRQLGPEAVPAPSLGSSRVSVARVHGGVATLSAPQQEPTSGKLCHETQTSSGSS